MGNGRYEVMKNENSTIYLQREKSDKTWISNAHYHDSIEFCFYIKDIAEYLQKSFNGKSDVPMSEVWELLDGHPVFPSDGFRPQIKNELKQNYGAHVSKSTLSFANRS